MHKTAQKRSLLNKLREMTNVSGIATEKFFNPEFQDLMDRLRDQTDDPIRSIVSGEAIGNASAPDDGISLKDLLKNVKSNINRREYMTAVAALSRFHRKMYDVVVLLKNFNVNVDKIHEKFLFEGLDDENKRHLHELKQRINAHDAAYYTAFIKEANILDFFTNIATERGRALAAWEKRYPKQLGKLKKDTASILQQSERLLSITLSTLKEMASARAVRNPDNYIKASDKIIKAFESYDKNFRDYYNANVKGFLEKQNFVSVDPTTPNLGGTIPAGPLDAGSTQIAPVVIPTDTIQDSSVNTGAPPVTPADSGSSTLVGIGPSGTAATPSNDKTVTRFPGGKLPKIPSILKQSPPSASPKDTVDDAATTAKVVKPAHSDFMNSLEAMSSESPALLSLHIRRYAKSIQNFDLETSIKLFKLAQSIKE